MKHSVSATIIRRRVYAVTERWSRPLFCSCSVWEYRELSAATASTFSHSVGHFCSHISEYMAQIYSSLSFFVPTGSPSDPPSLNVSLAGEAYFSFFADIYYCSELELRWEILRADGETEQYTVVNETYRNESYYGRYEEYPESGLEIDRYCNFPLYCDIYATINPTDLRYDGAQITGVLNLPECFNSSNSSDTMTLNIQGQFMVNLYMVVSYNGIQRHM